MAIKYIQVDTGTSIKKAVNLINDSALSTTEVYSSQMIDDTYCKKSECGGTLATIYGELYEVNESGSNYLLAVKGTYYKWNTETSGIFSASNYISYDSVNNGILIGVDGAGTYSINFTFSAIGASNSEFHIALFKNNASISKFVSHISQGDSYASFTCTGLLDLQIADLLDIRLSCLNAKNRSFTIYHGNLNIHRV